MNSARSERGSALVLAVLVLAVLTLLGLAGTDTSNIDLRISANKKLYQTTFYTAESGWRIAVNWLDNQYPPSTGDVGTDDSGGSVSFDSTKFMNPDEIALTSDTNYAVTSSFTGAGYAPGYSTEFMRYAYAIASNAAGPQNAQSQIAVTAGKIEYVGGY